jgi:hypothetical protein
MAGFLLHQGATVLCSHAGQAIPSAPNPRVMVSSQPTVLLSAPWIVAGCPLVPPPLPPCVSAQWIMGTLRVTSLGQPLVVQSGVAISIPNGTPLIPVVMQTRVSAM